MSFDLDTIQKMWVEDSKIDIDNLHTESLNIPMLHAKYFDLYNNIVLFKRKQNNKRKIFVTKGMNTFQVKQIQKFTSKILFQRKSEETKWKYLDADNKLSNVSKIEHDTMIQSILHISLKAIEFIRFQ